MEEKSMVRLLVLETDVEANFFKGILEDNNIHCLIGGVEASALGVALDGPDQIELFVNQSDVGDAKQLIMEVLDEEGDEIPGWTCQCGEEVDEGFGVCWSCGAEYKSNPA